MPLRPRLLPLPIVLSLLCACDKEAGKLDPIVDSGYVPSVAAAAPPEPPKAPEIIVDSANVSVGAERISAGEPGLADKVAVFVTGRPAIAGQVVDFVAMRNAKPSHVAAVASALRRAKAASLNVKTMARSEATDKLPLSLANSVPDCTIVAWIAKDAAIDVWPANGGTAKRIIKGMAGPDMTLGTEAVLKQVNGCGAPVLLVGADDRFPWGLVFDLATMSLQTPGARASAVVLVTNATPGRKVTLESL
jgi:hypothetical protein